MIMGADVSHAAPESKVIHIVHNVKGFKKKSGGGGGGCILTKPWVTKNKIPTLT